MYGVKLFDETFFRGRRKHWEIESGRTPARTSRRPKGWRSVTKNEKIFWLNNEKNLLFQTCLQTRQSARIERVKSTLLFINDLAFYLE